MPRTSTPASTYPPSLVRALNAAFTACGASRAEVYAAMGYSPTEDGSTPRLSRFLGGVGHVPKPETLAAFAVATGQTLTYEIAGCTVTIAPRGAA